MNRYRINQAVISENIEWSAHALRKMLERWISRKAVKQIIMNGEVIEDYPHDTPYPSALIFGMQEKFAVHAVISFDHLEEKVYVITAYIPDDRLFESDCKTRKKNDS